MSQQSLNTDSLKFVTDSLGKPGKRGKLSDGRKMACIEAMLTYRPFAQRPGNVTKAWDKVKDAINEVDTEIHPVGMSAIRNFVRDAINEVKARYADDKYGPRTCYRETTLQDRTLALYELMLATNPERDEIDVAAENNLNKKREAEAAITYSALHGTNKRKKEALIRSPRQLPQNTQPNVEQAHGSVSSSTFQEAPSKRFFQNQTINSKESLQKNLELAMEADEKERVYHRQLAQEILKVMTEIKHEICEVKQEVHGVKKEVHEVKERLTKLEESCRGFPASAYLPNQRPPGIPYPNVYPPQQ
ncbi:hypothetical protein CLU79DRAFT_892323 [Phycomyces nitens]|nr:hypothetical protein CLU79DRAFT_892323 [Phycomyces nitens]